MGRQDEPFFANGSAWNSAGENTLVTNESGWSGILPNDDPLKKNDSAFNATQCGAQITEGYEMDAIGYSLAILTLILVVVCWICNAVVVRALNQLGVEKMKVIFLLKNAILGDILLSITMAVRTVFALTGVLFSTNAGIVVRYVQIFYSFYGYFAVFYQIFTSMAVACDRFYSILKPLKYHSMRYSKGAKFAIATVILVAATSLAAPIPPLKLQPGKWILTMCYGASDNLFYSTSILPYVILSTVFATLFIYCGVLCLIAYHRRVHRDTLGEINESQKVRRRQASLAMTFFLIHITYVIMYIPGPMYYSLRPPGLKPNLAYYFSQITLIIYLSNTVIDPLIYIFRIKSIRGAVRLMFGGEQKIVVSSSSSQNTKM